LRACCGGTCLGDLLPGTGLGRGDLLVCGAADLAEFGGESAGSVLRCAGGVLGRGRVLARGGEGLCKGLDLRFGFGLAGGGGDSCRLRAAAAGPETRSGDRPAPENCVAT